MAADRGGKKRPGRFLSNAHEHGEVGGGHIYVSQDGSTHAGRKRMQKQQENTCAHFKVVMRGKKRT